MGCTLSTKQQDCGLPVYNMLVAGFTGSGKTTIINSLKGNSSQKTQTQGLQITTFNINNQFKILTFQVAGRAHSTWHHFYQTAKIVLMVIDISNKEITDKIKNTLVEIDNSIGQQSIIFILMNKCDLLISDKQASISAQNMNDSQQQRWSKQLQNDSVTLLNELKLQQLNHDTFTFKCSGKTGMGIKAIFKNMCGIV